MPAAELELSRHDLVCFAVPAASVPAAVAEHGAHIPRRAGVLVVSRGPVAPLALLPGAYVAGHTDGWAVGVLGGPADARAALEGRADMTVASADAAFRRQVTDALVAARFRAVPSEDVAGTELAAVDLGGAASPPAAARLRGSRKEPVRAA
jgi:glycerol-3-phosphate dehydrogenase